MPYCCRRVQTLQRADVSTGKQDTVPPLSTILRRNPARRWGHRRQTNLAFCAHSPVCFPPRSQPGLTPLFHTFVRRHIRRLKAYSSSTLTRRELSGYQVPGKRSITAQPPPVPFNPFLSFLVTSLCPAFIDPYLQPQSATSSLLHHPRR